MRPWLKSLLIGAAAGSAVSFVVWWYARTQLDKQLTAGAGDLAAQFGVGAEELQRRLARGKQELTAEVQAQVRREVPPVVQAELAATLSQYGITPATGQRLDEALRLAERYGVL